MSKLSLSAFACALFILSNSVHSEITDSPDFYSIPGVNKGRAYDSSSNVNVDLFGGTVTVSATDLVASGLGLDIVVTRTFNSAIDRWKDSYRNFVGARWSLHYGMLRGATENPYYCGQDVVEPVLANNTQFILPDGSSQIIVEDNITFVDADGDSVFTEGSEDYRPSHVTKALWRVNCKDQLLQITDKSGTSYIIGGFDLDYRVIKIIDRNGNYLDINYSGDRANIRIDSVVSSDSRTVLFNYSNDTLDSVSFGSQTVSYEVTGSLSEQRLLSVTHQDNAKTEYQYYSTGELDGYLKQTTTPMGKVVNLDYENLLFSAKDYFVVSQKCEANRDTPGGTNRCWNYVYSRQSEEGEAKSYDVTTVTGPDGVKTYKHYGLYYPIPLNESVFIDEGNGEGYYKPVGQAWSVGLLKEMSHVGLDGELVIKEVNDWSYKELSFIDRTYTEANSNYSLWDPDIRVPILIGKTTTVDNTVYEYVVTSLDGLTPEKYNESGSSTYFYDEDYRHIGSEDGHWILDLPFQKKVRTTGNDILVEQFTYDGNGNLSQTISKGVLVKYEYNPDGTTKAKLDAVDNKISYLDYYRGVPRREEFPDGSFLVREVDAYGRVTSETNIKNATTNYSYDVLNRVTAIDYPISDDVAVTYGYGMTGPGSSGLNSNRGHWVAYTQNSLRQVNIYNEYNKLTQQITEDVTTGQKFIRYYRYDDLNRLVFESYVNDETRGTTYAYDGLNRLVSSQKFGQPAIVTEYLAGGTVRVTDAEGNVTTKTYTAYSAGNKHLKQISAPEGVVIDFTNNALGNPLTITQDGVVREYQYDNEQRLFKYIEPEVDGELIYFYDHGGRVEEEIHLINGEQRTKRFTYDTSGRLKRVVFPAYYKTDTGYQYGQPSCSTCYYEVIHKEYELDYDEIGNLKSNRVKTIENIFLFNPEPDQYTQTSYRTWFYTYDLEDKLESETLSDSYEGTSFSFSYAYNSQGQVSSLTYPTGFSVDYAPDVFGRASKVGDLVTNIEYFDNGAIKSLTYGNGQIASYELNDQQMTKSMRVGLLDDIISFNYDYDFNGNLENIIDNLDSSKTKTMTYDGLDRLYSASGVWGTGFYNYDSMGNIESKAIGQQSFSYNYDARNRLSNFNGNDFFYDFNGRVKNDARNTYFYDYSNNLIFATNLANGAKFEFGYDANNKQSIKNSTDKKEFFVYATSGKLLFEQDDLGDFKRHHVYLGNKLVAYQDIQVECDDDLDNDGFPHCYERENGLDPYDPADGLADDDGDGLTNGEEYQLGTNQSLSDSDGDGIPDGWEIDNGLNPLAADGHLDNDGDGISNFDEFNDGSDPNVPNGPKVVPSLFAVAGDGYNVVQWQGAKYATSYKVYWSTDSNFDLLDASQETTVNTTFVHKELVNGIPLFYRVVAANAVGDSNASPMVKTTPNPFDWLSLTKTQECGLVRDLQGNSFDIDNSLRQVDLCAFFNGVQITKSITLFEDIERVLIKASEGGYVAAIIVTDNTIHGVYFDPTDATWSDPTLLEYYNGIDSTDGRINASSVKLLANGTNHFAVLYEQTRVRYFPNSYSGIYADNVFVNTFSPSSLWTSQKLLDNSNTAAPDYTGWSNLLSADINELGEVAVLWSRHKTSESNMNTGKDVNFAHLMNSGNIFTRQILESGDSSDIRDSATLNGNEPVWKISINDSSQVVALWLTSDGRKETFKSISYTPVVGVDLFFQEVPTQFLAFTLMNNGEAVGVTVDRGSFKYATWSQDLGWSRVNNMGVSAPTDAGTFLTPLVRQFNNSLSLLLFTDSYVGEVFNYQNGNWSFLTSSKNGLSYMSQINKAGQLMEMSGTVVRLFQAPLPINSGPTANAGEDIFIGELSTVQLDGNASVDTDGVIVSYSWTQVEGTSVQLSDSESSTPTFNAPDVMTSEILTFQLLVTDDLGATSTDSVNVTVRDPSSGPIAPVANAGIDQTVDELTANVELDGSGSSDLDGAIVSYLWEQVSGAPVTINNPTSQLANFTAPEVSTSETFTFHLTVTDNDSQVHSDLVDVTILDVPAQVDTTPPVTTINAVRTTSKGKASHTISFTVNEAATIYVRVSVAGQITGGGIANDFQWYEYTSEFVIDLDKGGAGWMEYYSVDAAGNEETIQLYNVD